MNSFYWGGVSKRSCGPGNYTVPIAGGLCVCLATAPASFYQCRKQWSSSTPQFFTSASFYRLPSLWLNWCICRHSGIYLFALQFTLQHHCQFKVFELNLPSWSTRIITSSLPSPAGFSYFCFFHGRAAPSMAAFLCSPSTQVLHQIIQIKRGATAGLFIVVHFFSSKWSKAFS